MRTYIEANEVEEMEQKATCIRDKLLIRLLFRLGCRVSEALPLTMDDIDLERGEVTIIHLKCRVKLLCPSCESRLGRYHRFCPVCGKQIDKARMEEKEHRRRRTLPVDSDTLDMIRQYLNQGKLISIDGKKKLFGINRHRAWSIIRECATRAGLPLLINPDTGRVRGISPHRLRDAFAVHAVKQNDTGDGLRLLQEHLGHASFNTTAKYRKVAGEEHRRWYDELWAKR